MCVNVVIVDATPDNDCGGVWQRTITAEDECGNQTTKSQTITVVDEVPPTIDIVDTIPTLELMATNWKMKQWHEIWSGNAADLNPGAFWPALQAGELYWMETSFLPHKPMTSTLDQMDSRASISAATGMAY